MNQNILLGGNKHMNQSVNKAQIPALRDVYEDYFSIGAAVNPLTLGTQKNMLTKHFSSMTAENEMKFEALQPKPNQFTFETADKMVAFAQAHDMKMRGHTLIWHNQTPDWMFLRRDGTTIDRETLLERMEKHIKTVMERYRGKIYCWDVVNEAVADEGTAILRPSKWTDIMGESFIEYAFKYAHEADPDALLFYNDYNACHPHKRDKIYQHVKGLIDKGVPIHIIGLQAHWNIVDPSYDDIKRAIETYASLGLSIHFTEMDVSVFEYHDRRTDLLEPTKEMVSRQAERYQAFFEIFRSYADVIDSVTFWGAADDYTWLDDFPVTGRKNWPFVFDARHQPKPAFWNIVDF